MAHALLPDSQMVRGAKGQDQTEFSIALCRKEPFVIPEITTDM